MTGQTETLRTIVRRVVYDNVLDLAELTRFAAKGRLHRYVTPRAGDLQGALVRYLRHLTENDFPAELLRPEFPQRLLVRTNSPEFVTFVTDLAQTLENPDNRVLYWYAKRLPYQRVVLRVPFKTVARSVNEHRHALLMIARDAPPAPTSSESRKEKRNMAGQTFDLYDTEATGRVIFRYWVFDERTDNIHDEGSLICRGDTMDEATRDLKGKLRTKLAALDNPALKVHVDPVKAFRTPKDDDPDPVVAALTGIADVIKNKR